MRKTVQKTVRKTMQKWYENRTLLNTAVALMAAAFIAYFFLQWHWGMPLFLALGTAIMIRGIVRITMRMRAKAAKQKSRDKDKS